MRRYAMTRIGTSDYVVPSNDGETVYRLSTYEDGRAHGLECDWDRRIFWRIRSVSRRRFVTDVAGPIDGLDWLDGDLGFSTRREALAAIFGADEEVEP